jgi:hypothetical protein
VLRFSFPRLRNYLFKFDHWIAGVAPEIRWGDKLRSKICIFRTVRSTNGEEGRNGGEKESCVHRAIRNLSNESACNMHENSPMAVSLKAMIVWHGNSNWTKYE